MPDPSTPGWVEAPERVGARAYGDGPPAADNQFCGERHRARAVDRVGWPVGDPDAPIPVGAA